MMIIRVHQNQQTITFYQNYLPYIMPQATSQVEKHFQRNNIYKRSKRYIDIERINDEEHQLQIYRRMPHSSIQTMDTRVHSSFLNAAELAQQKITRQISEFKKRIQDEQTIDQTNGFKQKSKSPKRIKGPDLQKMSPRKQFGGKKTLYKNEDQFNNYTLNSSNKSLNFKKYLARAQFVTQSPVNHKTLDIDRATRTKQKTKFNQSIYKCLFDYSKTQRFNDPKQKEAKLKQIQPHKIKKALNLTKVNHTPTLYSFYQTTSKDSPSQMDMKVLKNNEFFYRQGEREEEQFGSRKRKQDMNLKRLAQIKRRKNIPDIKDEMCEKRYFFRMEHKKK